MAMPDPLDLPKLQRDRLRAQANMFAAETVGSIRKATNQLDVLVVDTLDCPTLLRVGDLAVVFAQAVLVVVESKSDLKKGKDFIDAMGQIGHAKLLAGAETLTCLFCFAAPATSETLRRWLNDVVAARRTLQEKAEGASGEDEKNDILELASRLSAANLPDVIVSDGGAIAMRNDLGGRTTYGFYRAKEGSASIVALASQVLTRIDQRLSTRQDVVPTRQDLSKPFKILAAHLDAGIEESGDDPLDMMDNQPEASPEE